MARTKQFIISFFLLSILVACVVIQKAEYEFPAEMLPHVKQHYEKECEKGYILYNMNCAKCHTKKEKRKYIIPDFTPEQLKGYELRLTNKKHSEALTDSSVTEEELGQIMIFLSYKKKNATAIKR